VTVNQASLLGSAERDAQQHHQHSSHLGCYGLPSTAQPSTAAIAGFEGERPHPIRVNA
jgi:hypothetical protein